MKKLVAGMRLWLVVLVIAASLPLFLFATYSINQIGKARQEIITTQLLQRAEAAANAVNQRLDSTLGTLNTLATSDAVQRDDLRAFHEHARRVIPLSDGARAIALIDANFKMVFLTLRPFGAEGVPPGDLAALRQVFETGKPVVSAPFKSRITNDIVTTLGVPVFRNGKVVYCLRMVFLTSTLNGLLARQKLPADWTSSIVDKDGLLLARSRSPERYVGKPASPLVVKNLRAKNAEIFDSINKEGVQLKSILVKVPHWDWYVAIGIPTASLYAEMNWVLTRMIAFGLVITGAGIAAAVWLAGFISRHIARVAATSFALRRGEQVSVSGTPIRELNDMEQALDEVNKREQRTNLALMNIATEHALATTALATARRDPLTGLANRAVFYEMFEQLKNGVVSHCGATLAVLFIDLDGFKAVNDLHGHSQGDRVLVRTAEILRALTRQSDALGRMGGDEFVLCISEIHDEIGATAERVATRIIEQVSAIGFGISCSIGVAICPEHGHEIDTVLQRADEAMYEAKRRGKNCHAIYGLEPKIDGSLWSMHEPAADPDRLRRAS